MSGVEILYTALGISWMGLLGFWLYTEYVTWRFSREIERAWDRRARRRGEDA